MRAREAEELRAAIAEIEQAAPQPGEDADLSVRAERLANAEELRAAAAAAHEILSGDGDVPDVGILLAESRRALERGTTPRSTSSPRRPPTSATAPPISRSRSRSTSPTSTRPDPTSSPRSKTAARCSAA